MQEAELSAISNIHLPWNGWNEADLRTAGETAPQPDLLDKVKRCFSSLYTARPETIHSRAVSHKRFYFTDDLAEHRVVAQGRPVGTRIGHGEANLLKDVSQMDSFSDGQVLVTCMTDPDYAEFLVRCGIDSFSVTPDVAVKTRLSVAEVEAKLRK